ncbi:ABC transporter substrate-binding protein [Paenalcaligenes niemegkensis]|uniref:MlaC/ttg2D family ABC transporter substrate-binding protein n=1 Tax=Paenalcaligenes niemegkensis TaxID=2895469 RepID=UPI001EE8E827|nr:ABC transporter substrate-binding protein [Paenalcaligenes niemegkensis]MCQ9618162.1 ABC transporter substrate-binding protein [Paenalcaligenes niemegkensis]
MHTHIFFTRRTVYAVFLSVVLALCLSGTVRAKDAVDRHAPPPEFVQVVATNALEAVKADKAAQGGDRASINALIDEYVMPYVNFEKTTRLAAGRHWRTATPEQRTQLVEAFKNTLIRTYSGALAQVDQRSSISIQPFRGDPSAEDVVVRSSFNQSNGPAVAVDYRMENTPDGWKIYDINVENIWLIQNYRNQFSEQIAQNGITGLIDALNRQNR